MIFRLALIIALLAGMNTGAQATPHNDYMLKCMGCHGPEGAAVTGKVPPLKDHVARFLGVEGGRAFLVQVPGARQTPLNDKAVADLLNWLVVHFDAAHVPADFVPYTEQEVKTLRAHRIGNVVTTRADLMQALEAHQAE
tara:strand:- start:6343 stop:6759 length:417 start_codon:yes stop_codon:yes gene_type:complete